MLFGKESILLNRENLISYIFEVTKSIKNNEGVALCIEQDKGFEPWLKIELCKILYHHADVKIEDCHWVRTAGKTKRKSVDIVLNNDEWAISLKDRRSNTTDDYYIVLGDLDELKEPQYKKYKKSCVVFLTFSQIETNANLDKKVECELDKKFYTYRDFKFNDYKDFDNKLIKGIKGRIWFAMNS